MNTPQTLDQPAIHQVQQIRLEAPRKYVLSNGIPVYVLFSDEQAICKLELIYKAGRWPEAYHGIAGATAKLIREGAGGMSAAEISEKVEQYGASIRSAAGYDHATVSLFSLTRHLDKVLPLLEAVVGNPDFPQYELNTYVSNLRQQLLIKAEKVDYLADVRLRASLFGNDHPYGYHIEPADLSQLTTEHLRSFHANHYLASECTIIATGNVNENTIALLEKHLGQNSNGPVHSENFKNHNGGQSGSGILAPGSIEHINKKAALQSGLRLGRKSISKNHPDYLKLFLANTILGGFFGSRLMSNIREDKGYTYGIYSGSAHMQHGDYLFISTEVGLEVAEPALAEIRSEMRRLCTEPVSDNELDLLRNYLMGNLLGNVDGPFNRASTFKGLLLSGLDTDFLDQMVHTIQHTTTVELQQTAARYFNPDDWIEIAVGWPEK